MKTKKYNFLILLSCYCIGVEASTASAPSAATSGTPTNVTLSNDYSADSNTMSFLHYLLDFTGTAKEPVQKILDGKKDFFNKMNTSLNNLLNAVNTPGYTAYLTARDNGRARAQNPQELTSNFANAYTANQNDVDSANTYFQQLVTAFSSTINYEMLVSTLGEGSEIKLRKKLIPLAKIAARLFLQK